MVSFQCDECADTVKKPKLDQHRQRCWASFTCLDCSTTFRNQEYKSHTSCVSEAEKYQGALYKGPKKACPTRRGAPERCWPQGPPTGGQPNGQQSNVHRPQSNPRQMNGRKPQNQNNFTPAPPPDPSTEPAAPGIHPSRLTQISAPGSSHHAGPSPSFARGSARGRGRGGFARGGARMISGENGRAPEGGMRSWGSSPAPVAEVTPPTHAPTSVAPSATPALVVSASTPLESGGDDGKKKKRKKGDKGGTGSKANSKRPKAGEQPGGTPSPSTISENPRSKKRKRSASPSPLPPTSTLSEAVPEKTVKRLRKNLVKVATKSVGESMGLSAWLDRVAEGKKERIDTAEVGRAVKVTLEDGKWVLGF